MDADPLAEAVMSIVEGEQPSVLFVYDRVTPSVKAGKRYPITRKLGRFDYEADITSPVNPHAALVDLEGKNGALWTGRLAFLPHVGEALRFTVEADDGR